MSTTAAPLMVSISGVRGIAGESLTEPVVEKFVSAFAKVVLEQQVQACCSGCSCGKQEKKRPLIMVGRDSRVSGPWVKAKAIQTLNSYGLDVVDCGIVPTPTIQVMVQKHTAAAGLIITSSHNPMPWNGLKFVDSDGLFLSPLKCTKLFGYADAGVPKPSAECVPGTCSDKADAIAEHVSAILSLPFIDTKAVAECKFKVCLDAVCGAGGETMTTLLKHFGCEIVPMNLEPTGVFPHSPEPIPENLQDLCKAVAASGADFGIAVDPDVDRCVLIGDDGKPLSEEYTLALATQFILGIVGKRGPVCKNLSTTRAVDDIAIKYGCSIVAAPVGEIQVAKRMVEIGAVVGGEGNGGVMLPDVHIGRDAPVAAALTLQHLAAARKAKPGLTISQLKASLPQYDIVKLKTSVVGVNADGAMAKIIADWGSKPGIKINTEDGVHVSGADWWVHLRKSNTEPIIRVIGEAPNAAVATEHCKEFMAIVDSFKGK